MEHGRLFTGTVLRIAAIITSPMLSSPLGGEGWMRGQNAEVILRAILSHQPLGHHHKDVFERRVFFGKTPQAHVWILAELLEKLGQPHVVGF